MNFVSLSQLRTTLFINQFNQSDSKRLLKFESIVRFLKIKKNHLVRGIYLWIRLHWSHYCALKESVHNVICLWIKPHYLNDLNTSLQELAHRSHLFLNRWFWLNHTNRLVWFRNKWLLWASSCKESFSKISPFDCLYQTTWSNSWTNICIMIILINCLKKTCKLLVWISLTVKNAQTD